MAIKVEELRHLASDGDRIHFEDIVNALKAASLPQVMDLACLDDDDIAQVFPDCDVAGAVRRLRDHAVGYRDGWASLSVRQAKAVFIMVEKSSTSPLEEDTDTILATLAIRKSNAQYDQRVGLINHSKTGH